MRNLNLVSEEKGVRHWEFSGTDTDLSVHIPKEEKIPVQSLIVSDLHLGTLAFKARPFLAMLNTFWIQQHFILLGDIFEDEDFRRLSGPHWKVLSRIRKMTNPDNPLEEIWIEGNHDNAVMVGVIGSLVGLEVQKEFIWECGGKKYLAIHGDIFHWFLMRYPVMAKIVTWMYSFVQTIDPYHKHIGNYLAKKAGEWNGEHNAVAEGAAHYGKCKEVDFIICGHTHLAMRRQFEEIEYLNSGCWVKNPCSFITITEEHGPILNYVQLL